jgi:hypothetical protein
VRKFKAEVRHCKSIGASNRRNVIGSTIQSEEDFDAEVGTIPEDESQVAIVRTVIMRKVRMHEWYTCIRFSVARNTALAGSGG